MSEMSGFDRASYGEPSKYDIERLSGSRWTPPVGETFTVPSSEEEAIAQQDQLAKNGRAGAVLLLAFLHELEARGIPHQEALYLAAHVWQLT